MSIQQEKLKAIADKIRDKTGETDLIKPNDFVNKIDDVYNKGVNDGKKSQYDEFWDSYQQNGNRVDYIYGFYRLSCEYLHPKYKVIPKSIKLNDGTVSFDPKYHNMVYGCTKLKKIEKDYFDLSQYDNELGYNSNSTYGNYYTFANNPNLEIIEDVGMKPYSYYNTFRWCSKLHTIEVIRSNERTLFDQQVFHSCYELKNITIEGVIASNISFHDNPKLSKASIVSIVTHLSDTQGATLTLKKQAINREFPGEGEWDLFLAENKPSVWTINLV